MKSKRYFAGWMPILGGREQKEYAPVWQEEALHLLASRKEEKPFKLEQKRNGLQMIVSKLSKMPSSH